jgi:AraC-like DNA-binding protein/mannose-6-phosphate isomerase-like protein (cupin superfamily)
VEKLLFPEQAYPFFENESLPEIVRLTHNFNNPTWFYNFHRHNDQCEIIFVVDGKGSCTQDMQNYQLKAGDLILRNKDVIHSEASDPKDPLDIWTLTITDVHLRGLEKNDIIQHGIPVLVETGTYAPLILDVFEKMYRIRTSKIPNSKYICQLQVCELLAYIQNLLLADLNMGSDNSVSLINKIRKYIDDNYMERITLQSLSKMFHVSSSYISHKMVEEFGISPINYVIKRRIGEAQHLIVSSNLSISQIARTVGYDNLDHFNRLFYKCTGVHSHEFKKSYTRQLGVDPGTGDRNV